jgi:hypothetical protein
MPVIPAALEAGKGKTTRLYLKNTKTKKDWRWGSSRKSVSLRP